MCEDRGSSWSGKPERDGRFGGRAHQAATCGPAAADLDIALGVVREEVDRGEFDRSGNAGLPAATGRNRGARGPPERSPLPGLRDIPATADTAAELCHSRWHGLHRDRGFSVTAGSPCHEVHRDPRPAVARPAGNHGIRTGLRRSILSRPATGPETFPDRWGEHASRSTGIACRL